MKKSFIRMDFPYMSNPKLNVFAGVVISAMKDNPNFPAPVTGMDKVVAAAAVFSNACSLAMSGDKVRQSERDEAHGPLVDALKALANEVTRIAGGVRSILISSGYNVNAESPATVVVTPPTNIRIDQVPNTSNLKVSYSGVSWANKYGIYYKKKGDANAPLQHLITSYVSDTLQDLEAGATYDIYVKAFGAKRREAQSATVSKTVY